AKMALSGCRARPYVFAANPTEFVAYTADGALFWRRDCKQITGAAPMGIGEPVALSFTDSREIITATTAGWIVKLNPTNGSPIDAYKMRTSVFLRGKRYYGSFTSLKSLAVNGNVLYLAAAFRADPPTFLHPYESPVFVVRIELSQPKSSAITPLLEAASPHASSPDRVAIGVNRAGGSPTLWKDSEGSLLILANAEDFVSGRRRTAITAVEDRNGVLHLRWRSILATVPGDAIHAAPAL